MRKHEAWHPPLYEKDDVIALQALALYAQEAVTPSPAGQEAPPPSPYQCKRALDWIVNVAAGTYDDPFRPAASDVRDYLLGRRSVGLAVVKLMKLKIGKVFYGKPKDEYREDG